MAKNAKTKFVSFRVTDEERAVLERVARHFDRRESDVMRALIRAAADALPSSSATAGRAQGEEERTSGHISCQPSPVGVVRGGTAVSMQWFRTYHELLNDRKIARACRAAGQPAAVVVGVWTILLCMASESPRRGRLLVSDDPPMPIELAEIETAAGLDPITVGKILAAFHDLGMLETAESGELVIANWHKRQFPSDSSAARVRKHRQRKQQQAVVDVDGREALAGALQGLGMTTAGVVAALEGAARHWPGALETAVLAWVDAAKNDQTVANKPGFVRQALVDGWQLPAAGMDGRPGARGQLDDL